MQPAAGIRFIHAAIRREVRAIEDQAAVAESPDALATLADRLEFFARVVKLHTDGEEDSLYPALDERARFIGAGYLYDHRHESAMFAEVAAQIAETRAGSSAVRPGLLTRLRRQTVALTEHVVLHVEKEDALITPLVIELFSPTEQGAHLGKMMAKFPPDVMAKTLPWLVASLDEDDRVAYVSMIKALMPAERFTVAAGWIRGGVAPEVWAALASRVAGLPA